MKLTILKRGLALLCVFALLVALTPGALAYGTASNWAKEELDHMKSLGLIPQTMEEKEDLRTAITRLEMCEISLLAYETFTGEEVTAEDPLPFTDTDSDIAARAYAAGLVSGYPDGTFQPENTLTRQEFFAFVYKFLLISGWEAEEEHFGDLSSFEDEDAVNNWAKDAARLMVGIGVVRGTGTKLDPKGITTCEQALVMFLRGYLVLTTGEIVQPTEPEPTETEPTEPEPTEPEPTEPEPTEPEPTEPEPTEPEPTEPEPTEPPEYPEKYPNLSSWAEEELAPMEEAGLIPEILVGRDMTSPITRQEVCHIAVTAFLSIYPDIPMEEMDNPFTDTDDEMIIIAYHLGIVNGYPDGTFKPQDHITREQLFTIIGNFLTAAGYYRTDDPTADLSVFEDAGSVKSYALPATRLLYSMGIVKGSGNCLNPRANTQCQQGLALFFRTYNAFMFWLSGGSDRPEADLLVSFALQYVGYPYMWGGESPSNGFDCSGLVYYVYRQFGYKVPRTATQQWNYTGAWAVSLEELLPGDLVFFSPSLSESNITHVGIYIGNGQYIHAANSERGVVVDAVDGYYFTHNYLGARRIIP